VTSLDGVARALTDAGAAVKRDEPLARKTWWRVGGPADVFVEVSTAAQLHTLSRLVADAEVPLLVMGNASNLLVADRGVLGVVARLVGELAGAAREGDVLRIGGGARLVQLLQRCERERWTGLQCVAGVPGTLGGAVRMNAGTKLGELGDVLVDVDLVLPGGEAVTRSATTLHLSYRHSELPPGAIVASARIRTGEHDPDAVFHEVAEHLAYRARTQPIDLPTCGSTFRNPPGDGAGRLIEAAGLKGLRVGGAVVSDKHANFLVNTGSATAHDLRALIEAVRDRVRERFGITLVPEVVTVGEWA
jgi:UDP-N-acetylmuramate dehydrogenase